MNVAVKTFIMGLVVLSLSPFSVLAQAPSADSYVGLGMDSNLADLVVNQGIIQTMTVTDNDAQDNTLSIAEIVGGITVHTSVTGAGTVTTDTAANIIAGSGGTKLTKDNDCITHFYVNDGTQTLTFAGGTGVTLSDAGQTVAANESAILLLCRTSSSAVKLHIFGA